MAKRRAPPPATWSEDEEDEDEVPHERIAQLFAEGKVFTDGDLQELVETYSLNPVADRAAFDLCLRSTTEGYVARDEEIIHRLPCSDYVLRGQGIAVEITFPENRD